MTIRVLIVEDSVLTREILRDIFDGCDDFLVVGEAENGLKAIKLATELNPDLITMGSGNASYGWLSGHSGNYAEKSDPYSGCQQCC